MKNNETVLVTQEFDGKDVKNKYHLPISPEKYLILEKLRRELNFQTHDQVIRYLLNENKIV